MSQRKLLAQAIHDANRRHPELESEPCEDDYEMADQMLAKGELTILHPNDRLVTLFMSNFTSEETRAAYGYALSMFRRFIADKSFLEVDIDDVSSFKESLTGKPATRYTRWNGLSSFFKWLVNAGFLDRNPVLAINPPKRTRNRAPAIPSEDEMEALIGTRMGGDWRDHRDRSIIALCANGLRIAEIVALTWDNLLEMPEGWTLRVTGKGDKERLVPLSAFCVDALTDWAVQCGDASGRMFRDFANRDKPMTTDQVQAAFKRVAKVSGVKGRSPRLLRAHYATRLIRAGANVFSVQQLMGHEDISTTQVYVRLDLSDLRNAVSLDKLR